MSTHYYMVCREHERAIDIWYCSLMGGSGHSFTAMKKPEAIQDFLNEHAGCEIQVVTEYVLGNAKVPQD